MAKEKTIPIDVAAKTPLYVEIDADTTSVKFSFAEEGKATSYMYKVDGKKMTSQTDSKLSTVKKMKITDESTNSILSRIEGNTVFNVEKHHGYILWVRLFYEGNSESPCAEAVLVLAPAKLAILNVAACDDRDKTIGGAPFAYRANKRISFQFEYNRPLLKGEKPSILYKIYANKPGEKELCETPIIDSHKDIADLLCVDEGLPESHAGANLAISFGLNDPYEPPFEGKYKTVKFINLTSSEVHKPQITWIVWSSKESAEFGGKSPVRDKICSNEDAFLHIHTRGMYGQKVRVEIYEKDDTFTKALFLKSFNNLLILDNVACVPIAMDEIFSKAKQERWFEGSDYEIIAKVIPNDTSVAAAESKILKLDTTQKEAASPTKSTVNGTQKFTIGSVDDESKNVPNNNNTNLIFPLLIKPQNDLEKKWGGNYYWAAKQNNNQATYGRDRSGGKRKHAGRDLYTNGSEAVVAVCDGIVLNIGNFYLKTNQISILHETKDNRKFIVRYGELDPASITSKIGEKIKKKQILGKTGLLTNKDGTFPQIIAGVKQVYMLHFEYFTGEEGYTLSKPLTMDGNIFTRRNDISDPLEILQEGYKNSFNKNTGASEDRVNPQNLSTSQKGIEFIQSWEGLKLKVYNDSKGYATIGYGHLIERQSLITLKSYNTTKWPISGVTKNEFDKGLSKERANELFKSDLSKFEKALRRDVSVPLHQHEFDAIVSLLFNCGANFLADNKAPNLYSNLKQENYDAAAEEFRDIIKGGAGLKERRQDEINIFKHNVYKNHK